MKAKVRKIWIGVIGGLVLLIGLALLVLPGPAFIVIPAGLAILATEFDWAQRWMDRCKERFHDLRARRRARKEQRPLARGLK